MNFSPNKPPDLREHPHNIAVLDMTKIAKKQTSKGKRSSQNQQKRLIRGKRSGKRHCSTGEENPPFCRGISGEEKICKPVFIQQPSKECKSSKTKTVILVRLLAQFFPDSF